MCENKLETKEESPREQAKEISKGESKPHHIGKKTGAVLQQLFFSIVNEMNLENEKIVEKYNKLTKEILELPDGQAVYESFRVKYGKTKLPP